MLSKNGIGFVISGVRGGFHKDHLLVGDRIPEVNHAIKDIRQVANAATGNFYSIEKTNQYTLYSIYNPNTLDHAGRRAYISITLFTQKSDHVTGDLLSCLNQLMDYYVAKQGSEMVNRFTAEMFEEQFAHLSASQGSAASAGLATKNGYLVYNRPEEISTSFQTGKTGGYKSLFFINTVNESAVVAELSAMGYEKFSDQPQCTVTLYDFDPNRYAVYYNGIKQNPGQGSTLVISANPGESIRVEERSTGNSEVILVGQFDYSRGIRSLFSGSSPSPSHSHSHSRSHSHSHSPGSSPRRRKSGGFTISRTTAVLLAVIAFLILILGYIGYQLLSDDENSVTGEQISNSSGSSSAPKTKVINTPTPDTPQVENKDQEPPVAPPPPPPAVKKYSDTIRKSDLGKKISSEIFNKVKANLPKKNIADSLKVELVKENRKDCIKLTYSSTMNKKVEMIAAINLIINEKKGSSATPPPPAQPNSGGINGTGGGRASGSGSAGVTQNDECLNKICPNLISARIAKKNAKNQDEENAAQGQIERWEKARDNHKPKCNCP